MRIVPFLTAALLVFASACSSTTSNPSSTQGTGGSGGGDGGGGTGGTGGSGTGGDGGGATGELGDPCTIESCGEGLFCDFDDDLCGTNGAMGVCTMASNGASTGSPQTVCGCDGNLYSYWFEHQLEGYDAGDLSLCDAGEGKFFCGDVICDDDGMTYCNYPAFDCGASGDPSCETLPAECVGSEDCSCFGEEVPSICTFRSDGIFEHGCYESNGA